MILLITLITAALPITLHAQSIIDNQLAYTTSDENGATIHLYNPITQETEVLIDEGRTVPSLLTWSPDGSKLAFIDFPTREANANDIYVYDMATRELTRATMHPANDSSIQWTPDGERIVFTSARGANGLVKSIYSVRSDGSDLQLLLEDERGYGYVAPVVDPKGERLIFQRKTEAPPTGMVLQDNRPSELVVTDLNNPGTPQPFLPEFENQAGWITFAPGAEHLAFYGQDTPYAQFYVTPTETFAPVQVSQIKSRGNPGTPPTWKPDGSRLAFIENTADPTVTRIVATDPDGSNRRELVRLEGLRPGRFLEWSPGGSVILYRINGGVTTGDGEQPPLPTTHLIDMATGLDVTLNLDPLASQFAWRPATMSD